MQLNGLGAKLEPLRMKLISCAAVHNIHESELPLSNTFGSKLDPISKILFLDLWEDDRLKVCQSLKQLANLCFHDESHEQNRHTVFKVGGFPLLVSAMSQWKNCSEIQAEACRAVLNICLDSSASLCEAACGVGTLEAILAAMQRFDSDDYMQRVGCGALHALTKTNSTTARRLVVDLMGAFKVVRAMRNFPKSKRLQMWACCALADWAQWEDLRQNILDTGALTAIALVVEVFKDKDNEEDVAIQDKARSSIRNLSPRAHTTTITLVFSKRQCQQPNKQVRFQNHDVFFLST